MRLPIALALAAALAGCNHVSYRVIPSGPGVQASPKAPDCPVLVARTPIARPTQELSAIQVEVVRDGFFYATAEDVQGYLTRRACELGADAVLVTQDYATEGHLATMTGVALLFTERAEGR